METQINESKFLTIQEASEHLKVKVSTLYAWVYQRRIPFRKHRSRLVFELIELQIWSEKRRVPEHLSPGFPQTDTSAKDGPSSLKTRRTVEGP